MNEMLIVRSRARLLFTMLSYYVVSFYGLKEILYGNIHHETRPSFNVSPGLFYVSENKEAPLVERTPSDNWKWIGEGHDSKSELNAEWHRIMPALRELYYIFYLYMAQNRCINFK